MFSGLAPLITLTQLLVLVLGQNGGSGGGDAVSPTTTTTTTTTSTTTTTTTTTTTLPPYYVTSNRPHVREGWSSETQISEYVLPGKKVEFFDPRNSRKFLVVFKRYQFPADHPVFKSLIQKLAGVLTDMANQWNIKFLFRSSPASTLRITSLRDVIRDTQHIVAARIPGRLRHLEKYFPSGTPNEMLSRNCSLELDVIKVVEKLRKVYNMIINERNSNLAMNAAYKIVFVNGIQVPQRHADAQGRIQPDGIRANRGLLNSEIIINQAQFILRGLDEELTKEQNTLETILNGGVPARILSDMDVALGCAPHGTQDNIQVSQCFQSMGYIQCILDSFGRDNGVLAHELIPIPYRRRDRLFQVHFPPHTYYQINSGNIIDTSSCDVREKTALCPSIRYEANSCLEMLSRPNTSLPEDCSVEVAESGRPLIRKVAFGNLIAQRSETPVSVNYNGKSIRSETFVLSNSEPIQLIFGSEKIVVPPLDLATDKLYILEGNYTALKYTYDSNQWTYSLIPDNLQEIFVLVSLSLNSILILLALYKLVDIVMSYAGYDLLPMHQRRLTHRYVRAPSAEHCPREDIELHGRASSTSSWNRAQNMRAIQHRLQPPIPL